MHGVTDEGVRTLELKVLCKKVTCVTMSIMTSLTSEVIGHIGVALAGTVDHDCACLENEHLLDPMSQAPALG